MLELKINNEGIEIEENDLLTIIIQLVIITNIC